MKNQKAAAVLFCASLLLSGCAGQTKTDAAATASAAAVQQTAEAAKTAEAKNTELKVQSENLHNGIWDTVITKTSGGRNQSPQLSWTAVDGAVEYAVYMIDTTAGNWLHWQAYGIVKTTLTAGEAIANSSYIGPYPPSGTHTYTVYVYALKKAADAYSGAFDAKNPDYSAIETALDTAGGSRGNIIAKGELSGTYTHGQ